MRRPSATSERTSQQTGSRRSAAERGARLAAAANGTQLRQTLAPPPRVPERPAATTGGSRTVPGTTRSLSPDLDRGLAAASSREPLNTFPGRTQFGDARRHRLDASIRREHERPQMLADARAKVNKLVYTTPSLRQGEREAEKLAKAQGGAFGRCARDPRCLRKDVSVNGYHNGRCHFSASGKEGEEDLEGMVVVGRPGEAMRVMQTAGAGKESLDGSQLQIKMNSMSVLVAKLQQENRRKNEQLLKMKHKLDDAIAREEQVLQEERRKSDTSMRRKRSFGAQDLEDPWEVDRCPCGAMMDADSIFCRMCGRRNDDDSGSVLDGEGEEQEEDDNDEVDESTREQFAEAFKSKSADKKQIVHLLDELGLAGVEEEDEDAKPSAGEYSDDAAPASDLRKECGQCRSLLDMTALFCSNCGFKVSIDSDNEDGSSTSSGSSGAFSSTSEDLSNVYQDRLERVREQAAAHEEALQNRATLAVKERLGLQTQLHDLEKEKDNGSEDEKEHFQIEIEAMEAKLQESTKKSQRIEEQMKQLRQFLSQANAIEALEEERRRLKRLHMGRGSLSEDDDDGEDDEDEEDDEDDDESVASERPVSLPAPVPKARPPEIQIQAPTGGGLAATAKEDLHAPPSPRSPRKSANELLHELIDGSGRSSAGGASVGEPAAAAAKAGAPKPTAKTTAAKSSPARKKGGLLLAEPEQPEGRRISSGSAGEEEKKDEKKDSQLAAKRLKSAAAETASLRRQLEKLELERAEQAGMLKRAEQRLQDVVDDHGASLLQASQQAEAALSGQLESLKAELEQDRTEHKANEERHREQQLEREEQLQKLKGMKDNIISEMVAGKIDQAEEKEATLRLQDEAKSLELAMEASQAKLEDSELAIQTQMRRKTEVQQQAESEATLRKENLDVQAEDQRIRHLYTELKRERDQVDKQVHEVQLKQKDLWAKLAEIDEIKIQMEKQKSRKTKQPADKLHRIQQGKVAKEMQLRQEQYTLTSQEMQLQKQMSEKILDAVKQTRDHVPSYGKRLEQIQGFKELHVRFIPLNPTQLSILKQENVLRQQEQTAEMQMSSLRGEQFDRHNAVARLQWSMHEQERVMRVLQIQMLQKIEEAKEKQMQVAQEHEDTALVSQIAADLKAAKEKREQVVMESEQQDEEDKGLAAKTIFVQARIRGWMQRRRARLQKELEEQKLLAEERGLAMEKLQEMQNATMERLHGKGAFWDPHAMAMAQMRSASPSPRPSSSPSPPSPAGMASPVPQATSPVLAAMHSSAEGHDELPPAGFVPGLPPPEMGAPVGFVPGMPQAVGAPEMNMPGGRPRMPMALPGGMPMPGMPMPGMSPGTMMGMQQPFMAMSGMYPSGQLPADLHSGLLIRDELPPPDKFGARFGFHFRSKLSGRLLRKKAPARLQPGVTEGDESKAEAELSEARGEEEEGEEAKSGDAAELKEKEAKQEEEPQEAATGEDDAESKEAKAEAERGGGASEEATEQGNAKREEAAGSELAAAGAELEDEVKAAEAKTTSESKEEEQAGAEDRGSVVGVVASLTAPDVEAEPATKLLDVQKTFDTGGPVVDFSHLDNHPAKFVDLPLLPFPMSIAHVVHDFEPQFTSMEEAVTQHFTQELQEEASAFQMAEERAVRDSVYVHECRTLSEQVAMLKVENAEVQQDHRLEEKALQQRITHAKQTGYYEARESMGPKLDELRAEYEEEQSVYNTAETSAKHQEWKVGRMRRGYDDMHHECTQMSAHEAKIEAKIQGNEVQVKEMEAFFEQRLEEMTQVEKNLSDMESRTESVAAMHNLEVTTAKQYREACWNQRQEYQQLQDSIKNDMQEYKRKDKKLLEARILLGNARALAWARGNQFETLVRLFRLTDEEQSAESALEKFHGEAQDMKALQRTFYFNVIQRREFTDKREALQAKFDPPRCILIKGMGGADGLYVQGEIHCDKPSFTRLGGGPKYDILWGGSSWVVCMGASQTPLAINRQSVDYPDHCKFPWLRRNANGRFTDRFYTSSLTQMTLVQASKMIEQQMTNLEGRLATVEQNKDRATEKFHEAEALSMQMEDTERVKTADHGMRQELEENAATLEQYEMELATATKAMEASQQAAKSAEERAAAEKEKAGLSLHGLRGMQLTDMGDADGLYFPSNGKSCDKPVFVKRGLDGEPLRELKWNGHNWVVQVCGGNKLVLAVCRQSAETPDACLSPWLGRSTAGRYTEPFQRACVTPLGLDQMMQEMRTLSEQLQQEVERTNAATQEYDAKKDEAKVEVEEATSQAWKAAGVESAAAFKGMQEELVAARKALVTSKAELKAVQGREAVAKARCRSGAPSPGGTTSPSGGGGGGILSDGQTTAGVHVTGVPGADGYYTRRGASGGRPAYWRLEEPHAEIKWNGFNWVMVGEVPGDDGKPTEHMFAFCKHGPDTPDLVQLPWCRRPPGSLSIEPYPDAKVTSQSSEEMLFALEQQLADVRSQKEHVEEDIEAAKQNLERANTQVSESKASQAKLQTIFQPNYIHKLKQLERRVVEERKVLDEKEAELQKLLVETRNAQEEADRYESQLEQDKTEVPRPKCIILAGLGESDGIYVVNGELNGRPRLERVAAAMEPSEILWNGHHWFVRRGGEGAETVLISSSCDHVLDQVASAWLKRSDATGRFTEPCHAGSVTAEDMEALCDVMEENLSGLSVQEQDLRNRLTDAQEKQMEAEARIASAYSIKVGAEACYEARKFELSSKLRTLDARLRAQKKKLNHTQSMLKAVQSSSELASKRASMLRKALEEGTVDEAAMTKLCGLEVTGLEDANGFYFPSEIAMKDSATVRFLWTRPCVDPPFELTWVGNCWAIRVSDTSENKFICIDTATRPDMCTKCWLGKGAFGNFDTLIRGARIETVLPEDAIYKFENIIFGMEEQVHAVEAQRDTAEGKFKGTLRKISANLQEFSNSSTLRGPEKVMLEKLKDVNHDIKATEVQISKECERWKDVLQAQSSMVAVLHDCLDPWRKTPENVQEAVRAAEQSVKEAEAIAQDRVPKMKRLPMDMKIDESVKDTEFLHNFHDVTWVTKATKLALRLQAAFRGKALRSLLHGSSIDAKTYEAIGLVVSEAKAKARRVTVRQADGTVIVVSEEEARKKRRSRALVRLQAWFRTRLALNESMKRRRGLPTYVTSMILKLFPKSAVIAAEAIRTGIVLTQVVRRKEVQVKWLLHRISLVYTVTAVLGGDLEGIMDEESAPAVIAEAHGLNLDNIKKLEVLDEEGDTRRHVHVTLEMRDSRVPADFRSMNISHIGQAIQSMLVEEHDQEAIVNVLEVPTVLSKARVIIECNRLIVADPMSTRRSNSHQHFQSCLGKRLDCDLEMKSMEVARVMPDGEVEENYLAITPKANEDEELSSDEELEDEAHHAQAPRSAPQQPPRATAEKTAKESQPEAAEKAQPEPAAQQPAEAIGESPAAEAASADAPAPEEQKPAVAGEQSPEDDAAAAKESEAEAAQEGAEMKEEEDPGEDEQRQDETSEGASKTEGDQEGAVDQSEQSKAVEEETKAAAETAPEEQPVTAAEAAETAPEEQPVTAAEAAEAAPEEQPVTAAEAAEAAPEEQPVTAAEAAEAAPEEQPVPTADAAEAVAAEEDRAEAAAVKEEGGNVEQAAGGKKAEEDAAAADATAEESAALAETETGDTGDGAPTATADQEAADASQS
eukprot:TRINITY_DN3287_c0_g1_i4.p1 TRINITY_DN3287_c0_g1~~TRINITY_DN3287_c0_g1_i4.p1  ORF type:complete len:3661 (+),score=1288.53 TRINITY_DN3287_c0_g1_i4:347-11329(+)